MYDFTKHPQHVKHYILNSLSSCSVFFRLACKHVLLVLSDTGQMLVVEALKCWCGGTEGNEEKELRGTRSFLF